MMATDSVDSGSGAISPEVRALARRLLARHAAAARVEISRRSEVDLISSSRYRDGDGVRLGDGSEVPTSNGPPTDAGASELMARHIDLGKQLREAIRRSGLTRNQLAKRADLSYAIVHGFVAGNIDIQLSTAAKIAEVVDVEFRGRSRRGRG